MDRNDYSTYFMGVIDRLGLFIPNMCYTKNMRPTEKFHVMSLKPKHQAIIKLLLFNLFCSYVRKTTKSIDSTKDYYDSDISDSVSRRIINNFVKYDSLTAIFCSREDAMSSKTKLITLTIDAMQNVSLAIKAFNDPISYLDKYDIDYIKTELSQVENIVAESLLYTYTEEEIRRELDS